jgi:hypothetical protein
MAIFGKKYYELDLEKISARPITLAHDEILTNRFLLINRETIDVDADCGVAQVNRATRARYWHILLCSLFIGSPLPALVQA